MRTIIFVVGKRRSGVRILEELFFQHYTKLKKVRLCQIHISQLISTRISESPSETSRIKNQLHQEGRIEDNEIVHLVSQYIKSTPRNSLVVISGFPENIDHLTMYDRCSPPNRPKSVYEDLILIHVRARSKTVDALAKLRETNPAQKEIFDRENRYFDHHTVAMIEHLKHENATVFESPVDLFAGTDHRLQQRFFIDVVNEIFGPVKA
jgi:adenylate kinase family enzyme